MNSQRNILSEQTFQYDFFKTNVNFSCHDYFLSGKVYASSIHIEAGKGSVTWETFTDGAFFFNRQQIIAVSYAKVLKFKCKCTDTTQDDLQNQGAVTQFNFST